MFLRSGMASSSAPSICSGPGIRPQNSPIATAPETDRRFRHQRFGWCSQLPKGLASRLEGRDLQVVGVVAALPALGERSVRFEFDVESAEQKLPSRIQLSWYRGSAYEDQPALLAGMVHPGERWRFTVRLRRPHGTVNPHGFDYEAWLLERGIGAIALWSGRIASPGRTLALALAAVVIFDPWAPLAPGLWLSFGAVMLIFYVASGWTSAGTFLAQWGRIQWAITVGLAPAVLLLVGQVSVAGPLANAVAIPAVSAVLTPLDVGQGLAVLVRTSSHALLYDAGPAFGAETDSGDRVIVPYLRAAGLTRLDLVVLSHEDTDHLGGALTVLESLEAGALASSLPPWHTLNALVAAPRRCLAAGSWEWDGVRFEFVHPASLEKTTRRNNQSCVLRVASGGGSMLLTGDIERLAESQIIQANKFPGTDVLL